MKKNSEEFNQIFVVSFFKKLQLEGYDFEFWHCPNGGQRNKSEAARLKLMGVLPGVLDFQILSKNKIFFIEFKRIDGEISKDQRRFISSLDRYGVNHYQVWGDTPDQFVNQCAKIMEEELNINQKAISKCSASALSSIS